MSLRTVFERWSKAAERSSASLASCERALRLYEAHTNNIPIAKNTGPRLMPWNGNNNADVVLAANPPYGSYCIVATLEEYDSGQYLIVDWVQFSGSAAFY